MMIFGAIGGMKIGRGNRSTLRKPAPAPLCPPQNPTWPDPGSNPDRRGGKSATNCLSYGVALPVLGLSVVINHPWFFTPPLLWIINNSMYNELHNEKGATLLNREKYFHSHFLSSTMNLNGNISHQTSIYNQHGDCASIDKCRYTINNVCFMFLQSYFNHTSLVGTADYTIATWMFCLPPSAIWMS
jgi:hypothetical protein